MSTGQAPAATEARERRSLVKPVLVAGAVAGALGSIVAFAGTVSSWFRSAPEGTVTAFALSSVRPLTYGEWRSHENVPLAGVPKAERRVSGKLITYDVETHGYDQAVRLPVKIVVHDVTHHSSHSLLADEIRVRAGNDCGCSDWVAVPQGRARYYIEVGVYPPGRIRGQPLKSATTRYFSGV